MVGESFPKGKNSLLLTLLLVFHLDELKMIL